MASETGSELTSRPFKLKSLFKEQQTFLTLLREIRDGILISDEAGQILLVNDSLKAQFFLTDAVMGQNLSDVISDEHFWPLLRDVLQSGKSQVEELSLQVARPGHSLRQKMFFEIHVVPIVLNNNANGCVVVFHDITDIRQTERMRRDFVANVSHELRTPLSAIKGYSETLLEGALEDQAVSRDFVEVIYKHSQRLSQLVEDLLDLSKLESPDFKMDFGPLSIKSLILRVANLLGDKANEKELQMTFDFDDALPPVWAELGSLEQVVTNLLDNAIKYTPTHGKVAVRVQMTSDNRVQVDITNTGAGIEAKHLPRIFERFYRVDKARSRDMGGTGLGLSIVKHIIQLHEGDIWVKSKPHQETTFSFVLNVAPLGGKEN